MRCAAAPPRARAPHLARPPPADSHALLVGATERHDRALYPQARKLNRHAGDRQTGSACLSGAACARERRQHARQTARRSLPSSSPQHLHCVSLDTCMHTPQCDAPQSHLCNHNERASNTEVCCKTCSILIQVLVCFERKECESASARASPPAPVGTSHAAAQPGAAAISQSQRARIAIAALGTYLVAASNTLGSKAAQQRVGVRRRGVLHDNQQRAERQATSQHAVQVGVPRGDKRLAVQTRARANAYSIRSRAEFCSWLHFLAALRGLVLAPAWQVVCLCKHWHIWPCSTHAREPVPAAIPNMPAKQIAGDW